MGLVKLYSRALVGIDAPEVVVEVHVANGLPSFSIVGLPDVEVRESRDRVRSAIQMSGFDFPARRITVNLAPADLPKDSARYDLPIALGIMFASGLAKNKIDLKQFEFAGELALDGSLRKVNGLLPILCSAKNSGRSFILPVASIDEARLLSDIKVYAACDLRQVLGYLDLSIPLLPIEPTNASSSVMDVDQLDFSQVNGQLATKKALEVAASGRHSVLLIGNPGCGKSMLASRLATILPDLSDQEALQSACIQSLANGWFDFKYWKKIPFRQPHHTCSGVALVGGGSNPKPGEISLAHQGVLFLDELLEFDKRALEVLREPLENKKINLARAKIKVEYPADFQLIGAMNPCPCGNLGHPRNMCKCSPEQIARYSAKLSAPLLDRIDLVVQVPSLTLDELSTVNKGESSQEIKKRVLIAREIQQQRQGKLNYALNNQEIEAYCQLTVAARDLMAQLVEKNGMSVRTYYKTLKIARTVADIKQAKLVDSVHIAQAAQYKFVF